MSTSHNQLSGSSSHSVADALNLATQANAATGTGPTGEEPSSNYASETIPEQTTETVRRPKKRTTKPGPQPVRPTILRTDEMEPLRQLGKNLQRKVDRKDELKSEAKERLDHLIEKNEEHRKVQEMLKECYLGQGALYVIEQQHMVMEGQMMVANGPEFELHQWNMRPTTAANVNTFYKTTNDGELLKPMEQENALVFAISPDLVDSRALAPVQSYKFPEVKFKSNTGRIVVVNGHHHMQVLAKVNEHFLELKKSCETIVSESNKGKGRADVVSNTRSDLAEAEKRLLVNGKWGVIFLNLDQIMASKEVEKIKLYFARNISIFKVADSNDDTLQMLLMSVQRMSAEGAAKFIEEELQTRVGTQRTALMDVANNPIAIMTFSNLLAIPMFRDVRLVNYSNLYNWRKITRIWLDRFLSFAAVSYQYLALDPEVAAEIPAAEYFQTAALESSNEDLQYEFMMVDLLDVIDSSYKLHLASLVPLLLGYQGSLVIDDGDDSSSTSWETAFLQYRKTLLREIKIWVEHHKSTTPASPYLKWIEALPNRIEGLLDSGHTQYPFIRALNTSIPIFCPAFLADLASSIQVKEEAFIEFFTLFDPYVALRFGKNKTQTYLPLTSIFDFYATAPHTGLVSRLDRLNGSNLKMADYESQIEQLWALPFLARQTAIGIIGTMVPLLKVHRHAAPAEFKPSKQDLAIPEEHVVFYGLTALFTRWIKQQRTAERTACKSDQTLFTSTEYEYLSHTKKYGCVSPPSRQLCPAPKAISSFIDPDISIHPSADDFAIMQSTLSVASCSALPWGWQMSNLTQFVPRLAMGFLALHHEREPIYQEYLKQDVVWKLYVEMAKILQSISHSWSPWHGVTQENRTSSPAQRLPATREGNMMDSVVGAMVAQSAADVDRKFQKGIQAIWKIVQDVAGVPVSYEDEAGTTKSTIKLAPGVLDATRLLFKGLAWESLNARFPFDKEHAPYFDERQLPAGTLETVLGKHLLWPNPSDAEIILSSDEKCRAYGSQTLEEIWESKTHAGNQGSSVPSRKKAASTSKMPVKHRSKITKGKGKGRSVAADNGSDIEMENESDKSLTPSPPPRQAPSKGPSPRISEEGEASTSGQHQEQRLLDDASDASWQGAGDEEPESSGHLAKRIRMDTAGNKRGLKSSYDLVPPPPRRPLAHKS